MEKVTLSKPYSGRVINLIDLDIDANGLDVFAKTLQPQKIRIEGCRIRNAKSVFAMEGFDKDVWVSRTVITACKEYHFFCGAKDRKGKPIINQIVNRFWLENSTFADSERETVIRMMNGTQIGGTHVNVSNSLNPRKAYSALRCHCKAVNLHQFKVHGWTKFGKKEWSMDHLVLDQCRFDGGVQVEGKILAQKLNAVFINGEVKGSL